MVDSAGRGRRSSRRCSSGDDDASDATERRRPRPRRSPPAARAAARRDPDVDEQRLVHATVESSGGTRDFMVYVPEAYDPDVPAPVAYVFHGAGSNKEQQLVYSGFAAVRRGRRQRSSCSRCARDAEALEPARPGVRRRGGRQRPRRSSTTCRPPSPRRTASTPSGCWSRGMSSGGFMAGAVACARSDQVTAAGPVTATVWAEPICGDAEPVPYAYFHGTADPVVPYDGGPNSPGPVLETSQAWADQNGCTGAPVDERIGEEVVHRTWEGCDASDRPLHGGGRRPHLAGRRSTSASVTPLTTSTPPRSSGRPSRPPGRTAEGTTRCRGRPAMIDPWPRQW